MEVKPFVMRNGTHQFSYDIEYHRPLLFEPFEAGGYSGTFPTLEEALWVCQCFLFRNMLSGNNVELFGLATKLRGDAE